jgi:hypothetical protein
MKTIFDAIINFFKRLFGAENRTPRVYHHSIVTLSIAPMSSNANIQKEWYQGEVRINNGDWKEIGIPSEPRWEGQSGKTVIFEFRTKYNELPLRFNVQSYTSGRIPQGHAAIILKSSDVVNPSYKRFEVVAE